jgi:hypothetical protein
MTEINIGDEVYIHNFKTQVLTIEDFNGDYVSCVYLNRHNEFKKVTVRFQLIRNSNGEPITPLKGRGKNKSVPQN